MRCKKCGNDTRVIDSRGTYLNTKEGMKRRRRECVACKVRYTTYEVDEQTLKELLAAKGRAMMISDLMTGGNSFAALPKSSNVREGIKAIEKLQRDSK